MRKEIDNKRSYRESAGDLFSSREDIAHPLLFRCNSGYRELESIYVPWESQLTVSHKSLTEGISVFYLLHNFNFFL